jgi:hypothetical protein
MNTRPNISEYERQRRASQRAMSIRTFCENYGVGRTVTYSEIRSGRLKARKLGRRTIITTDDAEEWLNCLPTTKDARDEAAS